MELFGKSLVEKLTKKYGAKKYSKPAVVFLATDSRAAKERQRVSEWFNAIPEKSKANVKGRLTSEDDREHYSALNELVVARFLSANELEWEFEPEVVEGAPDFLVKAPMPFYMEVASVFELGDLATEQKKMKVLLDELSKIEHYFFLSISRVVVRDNAKYRNIKRFIREWMDRFDPETLSEIRKTNYREDGLELELMIRPKKSRKKGPIISTWMLPFVWVSTDHVARAIKKKIKKYKSIKKMGLPYVVVLALEDKYLDWDDVISVLYGKETTVLDRHTLRIEGTGRDSSGLLTPRQGDGIVQNRRLSAVLAIRKKWSEDGLRLHSFTIFHNPFAENPLPVGIFSEYAQFTEAMGWTKSPDHYELL